MKHKLCWTVKNLKERAEMRRGMLRIRRLRNLHGYLPNSSDAPGFYIKPNVWSREHHPHALKRQGDLAFWWPSWRLTEYIEAGGV
jgi:hypothetical protein